MPDQNPNSLLSYHTHRDGFSQQPLSTGQLKHPFSQLVSNEISFAALCTEEERSYVYTWGDSRYPVLGRAVSSQSPAGEATRVTDLEGPFKISKLVAGGWLTAAISELGEAWVWGLGCAPGSDIMGSEGAGKWLDEISEAAEGDGGLRKIISPEEGDEEGHGDEILDLAIGRACIILRNQSGLWYAGATRASSSELPSKPSTDSYQGWQKVLDASNVRQVVACGKLALCVVDDGEE
ncbi:MAG: hypothetical protein Q9162_007166 [Coniocarpon cinnabarinum]